METIKSALPKEFFARFCRKYGARELCLFGSAARGDAGGESDIDILVEFEPGTKTGIMKFTRMQRELTAAFGRTVDLVSKKGLNPVIREEVIASAKTLYAA